jgi:hypothetical protein
MIRLLAQYTPRKRDNLETGGWEEGGRAESFDRKKAWPSSFNILWGRVLKRSVAKSSFGSVLDADEALPKISVY